MAHANKPVKGTAAAVEQQILLSAQSGKELPVVQDQGKSLTRENDDSVLAGNAAATDNASANQVQAYTDENDAWSAECVAPLASTSDSSITTWRYIPAAASADNSDFPVQPRTVDMADSIKIQTVPFNTMDGLTVASGAFAFQHLASAPAQATAAALESAPAPALAALSVPAPDWAAVPIPAPQTYGDDGSMFRSTDPKLYIKLNRPLQTGFYVEMTLTNTISGESNTYSSKTAPASFVFMGQDFTFTPPGGLKDATYDVTAVFFSSTGVRQFVVPPGKLVVDTVAPTQTAALTAISSDTGISPHDLITNDPNQTFSGTLSAALAKGSQSGVAHEMLMIDLINQGSHQSVLVGGPRAADDSGQTWSFAPGFNLYDGTYTVQLQIKDASGNITKLDADPLTVLIDTHAPTDAYLAQTGGNYFTITTTDRGSKITGLSTTGSHLILSGSYTGSLADGTENGVSAEHVEVNISNSSGANSGWIIAPFDPATKTWTLDYSSTTLTPGTYNVQVRIADAAGNVAPEVTNTITVQDGGGGTGGQTPAPVALYSVGTAKAGLGYSMSVIKDFNGDGYADYLVSAPATRYNNGTLGTPAASYILYGGPNGLPNVGSGLSAGNLENLTAAQGIKITNSNTSGHFSATNVPGGTVTDIGDFNGDGLSDIAMVSPIDNSVYVLFGQRNGSNIDLARLTPSQGFKVNAATGFLYSVTGADVNGDGYSDLIFSDPTAGPKVQNVTAGMGGGAAYVVYGHAGNQSNISTVANTPSSSSDGNSVTLTGAGTAGTGYTVLTSNGYTGLGTVVNAVGDVNGDGYADYVVTAPGGNVWGSSAPGSAYLIFGGPNGITKGSIVNMTALDNMAATGKGIKINASNDYEFLGGKKDSGGPEGRGGDSVYGQYHSVSDLGNIDGSGKSAFAIGSPGAINPSTGAQYGYPGLYSDGAGAVYVMYGDQTNWSNITLPTYNGGRWTGGSLNGSNGFVIYSASFAAKANGTQANASDLGFAVSSAGDVNGDGISDILIGAPMANNGKGAVFLVFGQAGGLPWAIDPVTHNPIVGVVDLDQLVAAGKNPDTGGFGTPGTAVQYDGAYANLNSNYTPGVTTTNGGTGSNMGTDVTGGDFNGTGINSYVLSAWGDSVWNGQTGQAYVYDGTTLLLTQAISNDNGAIYYAGDNPISVTTMMRNGVDLIATGSGNNDWVHGIGTDTTGKPAGDWSVQHDAVNGGKGNDYIGIAGTNFTSIDGGGGWNTLVFEKSGLTLDLTQMGLRVQNIGQFDLSNSLHTAAADPRNLFADHTTGNTLKLSLSDVLSENSAASPSSPHMTIWGDGSSTVVLDGTSSLAGSGWMISGWQPIGSETFAVYHNTSMGSSTAADLLIQQGVQVI